MMWPLLKPQLSSPTNIYINKHTGELMLSWYSSKGGWYFDCGWDEPRFTILAPEEWGWEFLDYYDQAIEYAMTQEIKSINGEFRIS